MHRVGASSWIIWQLYVDLISSHVPRFLDMRSRKGEKRERKSWKSACKYKDSGPLLENAREDASRTIPHAVVDIKSGEIEGSSQLHTEENKGSKHCGLLNRRE